MRRDGKGGPDADGIARARITILLSKARDIFNENPKRGARYVELARKIALRHAIRLGRERKALFCKNCNSPRIPGKTSSYRVLPGRRLLVSCLVCGARNRALFGEKRPREMQENGAKKP